jgi:hypothetical protein
VRGGGAAETFELGSRTEPPAPPPAKRVGSLPPNWSSAWLSSLGATVPIPPGATTDDTGLGGAKIAIGPDIVTISRAHFDELDLQHTPALAESVASGEVCRSLDEAPLTSTNHVVRAFLVDECPPGGPHRSGGLHVWGEISDRAPHAAFLCTADLAKGLTDGGRQSLVDVRRICESIASADPESGCPGLPWTLTSGAGLGDGSGTSSTPTTTWFAPSVRWGSTIVRASEALKRFEHHGLATVLETALTARKASCQYRAGGRIEVSTDRCMFAFALNQASKPGVSWRIATVVCS